MKYVKQGYVWMQNWIANYILRDLTGQQDAQIWNNLLPMQFEKDLEFDEFKLVSK